MQSRVLIPIAVLTLLVLCAQSTSATEWKPAADLPEGWYAKMETPEGRIVFRLLPDQAPQSVAYFAALAEGKLDWTDPVTGEEHEGRYYDGAPVGRALGARLFQVGGRSSTDTFAPFLYVPEVADQAVNFNQAYRLGNVRVGPKLSAARVFITAGAMPGMNTTTVCFGYAIEGKETIFRLSSLKTAGNDRPLEDVRIESVRIFKVGEPAPLEAPIPYFESGMGRGHVNRELIFKDDGEPIKAPTKPKSPQKTSADTKKGRCEQRP